MNPIKMLFAIAALLNTITIFLPWWSYFNAYSRLQQDVFLFGFLYYNVDPPPNVWQYPSPEGQLVFKNWAAIYQPIILVTIALVCLGTLLYVRAFLTPTDCCRMGIAGCVFSITAAALLMYSISLINKSWAIVGSISHGVISWGPDAGFFLMLYSISIAIAGIILASKHQ